MKKQFDAEGLNELFDMEDVGPGEFPVSTIPEDVIEDELELLDESLDVDERLNKDDNYIDEELKGLIDTARQIMDGAKYLIGSCPDADAIAAAANLISSLGTIMSEFNKSVLQKKKFHDQKQLEIMKINARTELVRLRAQLDTKKIAIGDNNTIIQNNLVPYSQEDIIKNIIAEEKHNQEIIEN
jgi:hypothetical protein